MSGLHCGRSAMYYLDLWVDYSLCVKSALCENWNVVYVFIVYSGVDCSLCVRSRLRVDCPLCVKSVLRLECRVCFRCVL